MRKTKDGDDWDFPTWGELRDYLNALPEGDPRLGQKMEILPHQPDDKPVRLLPVTGWGTVEEAGVEDTRSAGDFEHHPDLFTVWVDDSPYSEDGDMVWEILPDGSAVGDRSGKVIPGFWPSREELEAARFTAEGTKPGSDPSTPAEG